MKFFWILRTAKWKTHASILTLTHTHTHSQGIWWCRRTKSNRQPPYFLTVVLCVCFLQTRRTATHWAAECQSSLVKHLRRGMPPLPYPPAPVYTTGNAVFRARFTEKKGQPWFHGVEILPRQPLFMLSGSGLIRAQTDLQTDTHCQWRLALWCSSVVGFLSDDLAQKINIKLVMLVAKYTAKKMNGTL